LKFKSNRQSSTVPVIFIQDISKIYLAYEMNSKLSKVSMKVQVLLIAMVKMASAEEYMSCGELFDLCVRDLETAAAHHGSNHDHRDCFHEEKFVEFVKNHDDNVIDHNYHGNDIHGASFSELNERLQVAWNDVYATIGMNDECRGDHSHEGDMNIDLHDLFLFDGTSLVRQLCHDVQDVLGVVCLPSVNFAYTWSSDLLKNERDDDLDDCIGPHLADFTAEGLVGILDPKYLHVHSKIDYYPCIDENSSEGCRFISNEIACDEIDQDYDKQDRVRQAIQNLVINDDELIAKCV